MEHILIIDDEKEIRELIELILDTAGYIVSTAESSKEAFNILNNNNISLIITDIIMPEEDGFELIMKMKRQYKNIKIIAISGGGRIASDDYLITAKKLGAHKTLNKPFKKDELINTVREVLGSQESAPE